MSIQITGGAAGLPTTGGTLTGPLAIAVGSAAAPGLAVAGDANTGLWAPAADVLAVSTAGVERLRIDAANFTFAGNVVIGTTEAPGAKLNVAGSSGDLELIRLQNGSGAADSYGGITYYGGNTLFNAYIRFYQSAGFGGQIRFGTDTSAGGGAPVDRMTINRTGNVGIGLTEPTAALHLPASSTTRASLRVPDGTAPTTPNDGDIWAVAGHLYARLGGVTKEFTLV